MDVVEEMLVVFVLLPDGWGFSVMVVTMDETNVVGWRLGPRLTMVDKKVEVITTGLLLLPPPPVAETGFELPEGPLDD